MKRFLSTTAVLIALSTTAYADGHTSAFGSVMVEENDFFASDLIGMRIYNSETEMADDAMITDGAEKEWDDIGEINDIIIGKDGEVRAVILGIGGFLGLGERDVSVSMDAIKVVREEGDSDDRFLVVTTSKEMLEKAPEFDRDMGEEMEAEAEEAEAKTEETAMEAERAMLTRPAVQRDGYQDVEWTEMTADDLEGARLYGMNDEDVGEIETLMVSDDGKITHILADIGGFLGMGEHTVKLAFEELQLVRKDDGSDLRVYVDSTEKKLEMLPEHAE